MKKIKQTQPGLLPASTKMPLDCRADYRLRQMGVGVLSAAELLTIVMGKGTTTPEQYRRANHTLAQTETLVGLSQMTVDELMTAALLTETEAVRIKAAIELGRRAMVTLPAERMQVRSPADVANLLMTEMMVLEREELRVVLLDTKNYILKVETVYRGNVNTAVIRVAELLQPAIRYNAPSMIMVHNHPSGDPSPSPEDLRCTELVQEAAKLMDIALLDHLIIGRSRFVSLKERGLGFR